MSGQLRDRVAKLEWMLANLMPEGRVVARDHEKGIRVDFGTDGAPCPSPWFQPSDRTGASRYVPELGEQVRVLCPGGDWRQGIGFAFTHSQDKPNPAKNIDQAVHHNRDGRRHLTEKGHVKDQAAKKMSRAAGDGGEEAEGSGKSGSNFPHEMQRQLQGIRATLTQHTNDIAGLHKATSQFRDIVQKAIPAVVAVQPLLNGDAESLGKAAQAALGQLESYLAKNFEQLIGKLTGGGFLSNIAGLVSGALRSQIGGLLGQIATLAAQNGLEAATAAALAEAQDLVVDAAAGAAHAALGRQLDALAGHFAGTPVEAAFGAIRSQLDGVLGSALGIAADLSGALDAQQNLVKGMTKSDRLGGYDGEE